MFNFFKKYKLVFYILAVIVFGIGSYFNFYDYFTLEYNNPKAKKMDLFGGIVFGILAIVKIIDVAEYFLNKKNKVGVIEQH